MSICQNPNTTAKPSGDRWTRGFRGGSGTSTLFSSWDYEFAATNSEPEALKSNISPRATEGNPVGTVILLTCAELTETDQVISRLRAAGIKATLPDEGMIETVGWNLNAYGFVRVQVSANDYEAARDLLNGMEC